MEEKDNFIASSSHFDGDTYSDNYIGKFVNKIDPAIDLTNKEIAIISLNFDDENALDGSQLLVTLDCVTPTFRYGKHQMPILAIIHNNRTVCYYFYRRAVSNRIDRITVSILDKNRQHLPKETHGNVTILLHVREKEYKKDINICEIDS